VDAAFMLLGLHESGIHALCLGTRGAGVTEVRFCAATTPRPIMRVFSSDTDGVNVT
jgi:hypothetical protein